MEKKELIKLYLQNVDKMFGYANMNAYIDERNTVKVKSQKNRLLYG